MPAIWISVRAAPLLFSIGKRNIVATASKESVIYLLDADNLGGVDHMTALYQSPRMGNDTQDFQAKACGAASPPRVSDKGERWLYAPMWGAPGKAAPKFPMTNGDVAQRQHHGASRWWKQTASRRWQPQWMSRDLNLASPPVVANGVVYALQTAESTIQVPKSMFNPDGSRKPASIRASNAKDRIMMPHPHHDPVRLRCRDRQGIVVQQEDHGRQYGAFHPAGGGRWARCSPWTMPAMSGPSA